MPRPKKNAGQNGARQRMIDTFWNQLMQLPYHEVTTSSITRQAECNRATFYYYFDSIEDLAEKAIDAAVPTDIANLAEKFLSEEDGVFRLNEAQRHAVERICLLAGKNGSVRLTERFKNALMNTWATKFGLSLSDENVRTIASFMASGIVGLLEDQANKPCDEHFEKRLQIISEVFSGSAIQFARKSIGS